MRAPEAVREAFKHSALLVGERLAHGCDKQDRHADQLSPPKTLPNTSGSPRAARIETSGLKRPRFCAGVGGDFSNRRDGLRLRFPHAKLAKRKAKGVVQTTEGSCVVIGPAATRHLGVKQFQPQHRPCRATDEQLLREGRGTPDMRDKLGLAAAKKLSLL